MQREVVLLIAEDDEGHAGLIMKNLQRAGLSNDMVHFRDDQEVLDYLTCTGPGHHRLAERPFFLVPDIKLPMVKGKEVLERPKQDPVLRKIPPVMVTANDDPREIGKCHDLGCGQIHKPADYDRFESAIEQIGLYLSIVKVPQIERTPEGDRG